MKNNLILFQPDLCLRKEWNIKYGKKDDYKKIEKLIQCGFDLKLISSKLNIPIKQLEKLH